MTSGNKLHKSVHVLSKKSSVLGRDTFLFWPGRPSNLLLGLNQNIMPVSSAKLHRWIRIIDPNSPDFELRPAELKKAAIFTYVAFTAGPVVSSESTLPLPPHDYGWFYEGYDTDDYRGPPFFQINSDRSFEKAKIYAEQDVDNPYWSGRLKLYAFPPSFEESVLLRDAYCFITGPEASSTDSDVGVSWIIPPAWTDRLYPRDLDSSEKDRYISISNAGVMRKDIMALFHDNAFGVDVDDDYRIVAFRDLGSVTLPPKLHRDRVCPGPNDEFLREHFRWCLIVYILGGDIKKDYNFGKIYNTAEELGVEGDEFDLAPLDDPRWQTVLGKELLESHIGTQLYWAGAFDSDD